MIASELRIGNLFFAYGKIATLTSINCSHKEHEPHLFFNVDGDERRHSAFLNDKITGIPLTEDWLLRFGLVKQQEVNNTFYCDIDKYRICFPTKSRKTSLHYRVAPQRWYPVLIESIQYVHELQNAIFILTKTDLTFTK